MKKLLEKNVLRPLAAMLIVPRSWSCLLFDIREAAYNEKT